MNHTNSCACYSFGFGEDGDNCVFCERPKSSHSPEALRLATLPPAPTPKGPACFMPRAQADLFASDIALVAQGIQQFFGRVEQDPELHGKSLEEIVILIQQTGALDALAAQVQHLHEFIQQITNGGWKH